MIVNYLSSQLQTLAPMASNRMLISQAVNWQQEGQELLPVLLQEYPLEITVSPRLEDTS